MVELQIFQSPAARYAQRGNDAERHGHRQPGQKQREARRRFLFALDFGGNGGESAQHQAREQADDDERHEVDEFLHGEKAEHEPDDETDADG